MISCRKGRDEGCDEIGTSHMEWSTTRQVTNCTIAGFFFLFKYIFGFTLFVLSFGSLVVNMGVCVYVYISLLPFFMNYDVFGCVLFLWCKTLESNYCFDV